MDGDFNYLDAIQAKTRDTMVAWLERFKSGEVEPDEAADAIAVLWDMSSGICGKRLMDQMAEAIEALRKVHDRRRVRTFVKDGRIMMVRNGKEPNVDLNVVTFRAVDGSKVSERKITFGDRVEPYRVRAEQAEKIRLKLKAEGYKEIEA